MRSVLQADVPFRVLGLLWVLGTVTRGCIGLLFWEPFPQVQRKDQVPSFFIPSFSTCAPI